jgi:hypothetical protein
MQMWQNHPIDGAMFFQRRLSESRLWKKVVFKDQRPKKKTRLWKITMDGLFFRHFGITLLPQEKTH